MTRPAQTAEQALAKKLSTGDYIRDDIGLQKRCLHCKEYWPADSEFFDANAKASDRLSGICKACSISAKNNRIAKRVQTSAHN